jgi:hypothetical protein
MTEGISDININDIIIEQSDTEGLTLGHVIDVSPNWVTIHWLMGANNSYPSGTWACPIDEARKAITSGDWEIYPEETRFDVET